MTSEAITNSGENGRNRWSFSRLFFWRKDYQEDEPDKSWLPFINNVSKIHALEAHERYWILRREIEMNLENTARCLGTIEWRYHADSGIGIDRHIERLQDQLRDKMDSLPDMEAAVKRDSAEPPPQTPPSIMPFLRLLYYYKIILKNRKQLTRKYQDLNLLWRDMNFIRTRLLTDGLIEVTRVPHQLDFCRIEARNLALVDDPQIKSLLDQAAEEINVSETAKPGDALKARRIIITLMTKLNEFRIRRMFEQLYKKRMYMLLCFVLLILSTICFDLRPYLVDHQSTARAELAPGTIAASAAGNDQTPLAGSRLKGDAQEKEATVSLSFFQKFLHNGEKGFLWCTAKVASNPLIFIFFAGFTGGIFSNMMRFQPSSQLPGDELYIFWYRITKPVIGAFGAMVLFVILLSPVFRGSVEAVFTEEIVQALTESPTSATGFAFGFLMGFSERVILPKLN